MKGVFRKVFGAIAGVAVLLAGATPALADNGGGTGTGGSWNNDSATGIKSAWADSWRSFVDNSGFSEARVIKMLNDKTPGLATECMKSSAIFFPYSPSFGGIWVWNYQGTYIGGKPGIDAPALNFSTGRTAPSAAQKGAAYWVLKNDGKYDDYLHLVGPESVAVICSYRGEAVRKTEWEYNTYTGHAEYEKVLPYSYTTTVAPMKIEGQYVGNGEWEAQKADTKKTVFAKVYDELATGKSPLRADEVESLVKSAIAADAKADYSTSVELSDKNKAAFARGGVVNVSEYTQYAKIRAISDFTAQQKRQCTYDVYSDGRKELVSCGPWQEVSRVYNNSVNKELRTPYQSGFWQMINVHCNLFGFNDLVAKTGASVVSRDDENGKVSAVAKTKYYKGSEGKPAQPSVLDFGQPGTPSGSIGFYDKECAFTCSADNSDLGGAKPAEEAEDNLGTEGDNGDSNNPMKNGADADNKKVRGNNFTFFRDNEEHGIHVDLWQPKATGNVEFNGESPKSTTVSRWKAGTPDVVTTDTQGGKFTMKTTNGGTELFTGSDSDSVPTQRNWDNTPFSSRITTILNGAHNNFTVQGSWASEKGRPNVLSFKWMYAPNVSALAPTKLGTSRTGDTVNGYIEGNNAKLTTPIEGNCLAFFGQSDHDDTTELIWENTGSGTTNKLDGVFNEIDNMAKDPRNLVITHVRATAE